MMATKSSFTSDEKARIRWACRRGMLELDVMIMPFYEQCFEHLTKQQQHDFVDLLACDDPDLFKWLMKHGRSDNEAIAAIADKIIAHNLAKTQSSVL